MILLPLLCAAALGAGTDTAQALTDSVQAVEARPDSASLAKLRAAQVAWDRSAPTNESQGAPLSGPSLVGGLFQVLAGLGFLGLVGVGGFLVVKKARGRNPSGRSGSMMDLLETAPAGPGRHICLVRIHDRVVAVAFAGSGAAAVAEFTGEAAAEILADSGNGRTSVRDFSTTLETFMERFRKNPASGGSVS